MPKFSYTVINPEGLTLNGIIEAENESSAREKLNKMDFSVVEIMPLSEEEKKEVEEEIVRYEFEGVDQAGRKIKGTIDAADKYSAFKRLVSEYRIEIAALYKGAATEEEKEAEKEKGVVDLYARLKKEQAEESAKNSKKILHEIKIEEKKYIEEKIDFVLKKVDELLTNFSDILKQEEKNDIEKQRDKLLRLKTSSNIQYLEQLCEELLNRIQSQEIYISQKVQNERVEKFNIEIKEALSDIRRNKSSLDIRNKIIQSIAYWRTNNIDNTKNPSLINKIINRLLLTIEEWLEEDPRITEAKNKLRTVKQKIKDYKKIYKQELSEEIRKEIKESIKKFQYEKEYIEDEIKNLKISIKREIEAAGEESMMNKIISELATLTGYLLAIYILFYLVSEYMFTKNLGIKPENYIFSIQRSIQFHYIVAILFISNVILSGKCLFFKKSRAGAFLTFPLILLLSLLIILNF